MQKILLINPAKKSEEFGLFKEFVAKQVPLSLGVIAAYLRKNGIEAMIYDQQMRGTDPGDLREFCRKNRIKIVGISCYTAYAKETYQIARNIKEFDSSIKIVVGGIHATVLPEEVLNTKDVDFVVRGEGEIAFRRLVDYLRSGRNLESVPNISYRNGGGEGIVHHQISKDLIDLNELPPFPFELFEDDIERYAFGQLMSSRGCPYSCSFCSQRLLAAKDYRFQSPEKTLEEIDLLVRKYNQRKIFFADDHFLLRKERIKQLCRLIEEQDYPEDLKFFITTRADYVNEEILGHLKKAGFHQICLGIETASERIMKTINKKETVKDNIDSVYLIARSGLVPTGSFIIGFPTETKREIIDTIKLSYRLPLAVSKINVLIPYPGTPVYEQVKDRVEAGEVWSNMVTVGGLSGKGIPYSPEGISRRELMRLQMMGNFVFWLKPKRIKYLFSNNNIKLKMPPLNSFRNIYKVFAFVASFFMQVLRGGNRNR